MKQLCEAEVASSCAGLIWCRVCHYAPLDAGVFAET